MSIALSLSPEHETKLKALAMVAGISTSEYATKIVADAIANTSVSDQDLERARARDAKNEAMVRQERLKRFLEFGRKNGFEIPGDNDPDSTV